MHCHEKKLKQSSDSAHVRSQHHSCSLICQIFLDSCIPGVDVSLTATKVGSTALHYAFVHGHMGIAILLLKEGK